MASFGLDIYNYVWRYCDIRYAPPHRQWRIVQFYDAFNKLSELSLREGPLYVFSEFNTDYDNKTFDAAFYPFDTLRNPSLSSAHPRLAALIVDRQYFPYFIKNFRAAKLMFLNSDTGPDDPKPFVLILIPKHFADAPRHVGKLEESG